jgi:hypothetical protein
MDPKDGKVVQPALSLSSTLLYTSTIYGVKILWLPYVWARSLREYFYPPPGATPNAVKTYQCRPNLPVR